MADDLITANDLKTWLGMEGTADDAIIAALAISASDDFKHACSQNFVLKDYEEHLDGEGRKEIYLSEAPLVLVTSLTDEDALIGSSEYVFYARPPRIRLKTGRFSTTPQGVVVAYQAGYETIPGDIKAACCALGVFLFNRRRSLGKSSEVVAGMSVTADNVLPDAVAKEIVKHRKTWGWAG
jgi:hypothetical protein